MIFFAANYFKKKKLRYTLAFIGIAIVLILINVLNMTKNGLINQFSSYVRSRNFDIIATVTNSFELASNNYLPAELGDKIAKVRGVRKVSSGLAINSSIYTKDGKKANVMIVGYSDGDLTAPKSTIVSLKQQSNNQRSNSIIIDRSIKFFMPVSLGSIIKIKGKYFRVGAITEGEMLYTLPIVFMRLEELRNLAKDKLSNYLLINSSNKEDKTLTIRSLEERFSDEARFATKIQNVGEYENSMAFYSSSLNFLALVILVVGIFLIGLNTSITTMARRREFGILMALGAKRSQIISLVVIDCLLIGIASFFAALIGTFFVSKGLSQLLTFNISISPKIVISTFGIAVFVSLIGGFFGSNSALKADPLVAISSVD